MIWHEIRLAEMWKIGAMHGIDPGRSIYQSDEKEVYNPTVIMWISDEKEVYNPTVIMWIIITKVELIRSYFSVLLILSHFLAID
jgi:hypothetical protein